MWAQCRNMSGCYLQINKQSERLRGTKGGGLFCHFGSRSLSAWEDGWAAGRPVGGRWRILGAQNFQATAHCHSTTRYPADCNDGRV